MHNATIQQEPRSGSTFNWADEMEDHENGNSIDFEAETAIGTGEIADASEESSEVPTEDTSCDSLSDGGLTIKPGDEDSKIKRVLRAKQAKALGVDTGNAEAWTPTSDEDKSSRYSSKNVFNSLPNQSKKKRGPRAPSKKQKREGKVHDSGSEEEINVADAADEAQNPFENTKEEHRNGAIGHDEEDTKSERQSEQTMSLKSAPMTSQEKKRLKRNKRKRKAKNTPAYEFEYDPESESEDERPGSVVDFLSGLDLLSWAMLAFVAVIIGVFYKVYREANPNRVVL